MAGRGSFQKRQKEAARKEKRQEKLDRRQGRAIPGAAPSDENTENGESSLDDSTQDTPVTPDEINAAIAAVIRE